MLSFIYAIQTNQRLSSIFLFVLNPSLLSDVVSFTAGDTHQYTTGFITLYITKQSGALLIGFTLSPLMLRIFERCYYGINNARLALRVEHVRKEVVVYC